MVQHQQQPIESRQDAIVGDAPEALSGRLQNTETQMPYQTSHAEILENVHDWHLKQMINARDQGRERDSARHHRIANALRSRLDALSERIDD
ncbi:hypothetical protein [Bradyrhizobium elkanii]|uniref:hypothetical protein n=1 Tax=Bradyrhizobium elkanii TaxID=29448 RepID=UPI002166C53E|nr:hypothetical protein [Bradyrhizobium elkanii]MCS3689082.1 hypothetical protein [Bradyrhizobium elkanii]